jgi:hypothetical protein
LALALLLQVAGIAVLRYRLGKEWVRRPVVLLYLSSVLYQGVSAVMLTCPPWLPRTRSESASPRSSQMTARS